MRARLGLGLHTGSDPRQPEGGGAGATQGRLAREVLRRSHEVTDPEQRDMIYQRVIPEERGRDPDKNGIAVLIRVDRIRQGPNSVKRT